jgi:transcription elongation factor GreA
MPEAMYLTPEGMEKLQQELEQLKGPRRRDLARRLRSAIQMGDLSENADYHKAKEDQGFLEGRIQEIEYLLRNAVIIQKNATAGVVGLGHHITIQEGSSPPETYHLVGASEADPGNGRISNESPIGRALADRKVGEVVEVEAPGGRLRFTILKIE